MASLLPPCTCGYGRLFITAASQQQRRLLSSTSNVWNNATSSARKRRARGESVQYQFNQNPFDPAPVDPAARASYQFVNAAALRRHTTPPRKVRMLARDFIDDSLYNPNYGYFPKQAVIFDPGAALVQKQEGAEGDGSLTVQDPEELKRRRLHGFDFSKMRNNADWDRTVAETYGIIEEAHEGSGPGRQVWHTPTELFKVNIETKLRIVTISFMPADDFVLFAAILRTSCRKPPCHRIQARIIPLQRLEDL